MQLTDSRNVLVSPLMAGGGETITMSSREIAELTGKRHDNVMQVCRDLAESGIIGGYPEFQETPYVNGQNGQTYKEFRMNKRDSLVLVARLCPEFMAKVVDRWMELEAGASRHAFTIPTTLPDALRLAAEQMERAERAERTKAEIGTRREATAMNTASQAVKRANDLRRELDRSQEYATVKRMSMLYHGQRLDWRMLKHVSAEIGMPPIDVFDANYGTVKAYHADAWREAYALEIPATIADA